MLAIVTHPDRLTGLDASFLAVEDAGPHMHVGSVMLLEGPSPAYVDVLDAIESKLHLVPRYRQKLAFPPLGAGRPVWVDDPHFNARYHLRHTGLPAPAGVEELRRLAGRLFAQRLDRSKPLWELWLVDKVGEDHFALISKTHHALVDGVSGVDLATVIFDLEPEPPPSADAPRQWFPRPEPTPAVLLADALSELAAAPLGLANGVREAVQHPERTAGPLAGMLSLARVAGLPGLGGAPPSPINVPIGPHRRFAWVEGDLKQFKEIKTALGGTVNDVVLAAVTGALRAHLMRTGTDISELELKAMVPMSIRAEAERGALGNRVTTMYAPLPVYAEDPLERFAIVHEAMAGLKESGQAVGAEVLTKLTGFAPPTVLAQAARLQGSQRFFNLTVTNVPGPQFPLYMLGRRLRAIYPQVPLVKNTALGIAIMSYDGALDFGLLSDYDALPELDRLAADLEAAIDELATAAGASAGQPKRNGRIPRGRERDAARTQ
jgi:diacylglycerol O-acyltransferase / wax synthase